MATWTTPKTNWQGTDHFSVTDWQRITGNLEYLCDELSLTCPTFLPATNHRTLLTSKNRNDVTDTLELIYAALSASWDRTFVFPRVDYGATWNSRDLNAIETLMLNCKEQIDGTISNIVEYYADDEIYCGTLSGVSGTSVISVGLL